MSQSGETADVIKAARILKGVGQRVVAITNVMGSSISRLADRTIQTQAGPEISVASTKAFTAQLAVLYWLAISNLKINISQSDKMLMSIKQLPNKIRQVLDKEQEIGRWGSYLAGFKNAFYIGRGINYPVALEGALKLKEISYIHAEGCAAGELKHGPFALLGEDTPVVALLTKDDNYELMMTGIREVKARKSPVIAVAPEDLEADVSHLADAVITVPEEDYIFSPILNTVVLQLLAYYAAKHLDCPIDFPRNLAKSVTVE